MIRILVNCDWDGNNNKWAVQMGNWKIVSPRQEEFELYDLKNDPGKKNNLAKQHQERVSELKVKYTKWRNEMATPMGDKK